MIRLGDVGLGFHVGPIGHPSAFETQAIIVAGEFGSGDQVVVGVLDVIGVNILLTADVGGVAAAEAGTIINAHFIGSLGGVVHDGATHVDAEVGFVDGTHHRFGDVGKTFVHTVALVVVFHVVTCLLALDLLEQDAGATEEILVGVLSKDTQVTARCKGADDHRALHELEVTRGGVAREREVGFLATDAELPILQSVVADDSVFQLEGTVGQFHVDLTIPIRGDLRLDGETGAADAGARANRVSPFLGTEIMTKVDLNSGVKPELVVFVLGFEHQDTVAA